MGKVEEEITHLDMWSMWYHGCNVEASAVSDCVIITTEAETPRPSWTSAPDIIQSP